MKSGERVATLLPLREIEDLKTDKDTYYGSDGTAGVPTTLEESELSTHHLIYRWEHEG